MDYPKWTTLKFVANMNLRIPEPAIQLINNHNYGSLAMQQIIIIIIKMIIIIIIIMHNLYSAISVSSMALYNSCNFKKEIHLSY